MFLRRGAKDPISGNAIHGKNERHLKGLLLRFTDSRVGKSGTGCRTDGLRKFTERGSSQWKDELPLKKGGRAAVHYWVLGHSFHGKGYYCLLTGEKIGGT